MKKLSDTQKKVLDFLSKHVDANPELISKETGVTKLNVFSALKNLCALNVVEMKEEQGEKTYNVSEEIPPASEIPEVKIPGKKKEQKKIPSGKRDFTKYKFNGEAHSKGKLVHAIVLQYTRDHRNTTVAKLREVFPDEIIPTYGVFQELSVAKKRSVDRQRYFLKPEQLIKLKDKTIAVTNQLTATYLDSFLSAAKKVGYKAQPV